MRQNKELIEGNIEEDSEFEHIKIIYLKQNNVDWEQQNFGNIEKFTDWYKKQNFNSYPTIFSSGEYQYKIKLFCSNETKEYLENNFEFSSNLSSFWSHDYTIKINIPNFNLIKEINNSINNKILNLKNIKTSTLQRNNIKEFYTNKYLNGIFDFVLKMNKIKKEIANNKDNKNSILILLDSWVVKFYEICHKPKNNNHLFVFKCNDFYKKYFPKLSILDEELNLIANYVWDNEKSWVYIARNKSGIVHPINFNNKNSSHSIFQNNLLCEIYQNDKILGLGKILEFINQINEICINLCSLYFSIRSKLMHTKNSKYPVIDFEQAKSFLFYSYF